MNYIFELTGNCPHPGSPLNFGGNAYDVGSLNATCSVCGVAATINYGQAIGLDRTDPGFENRIDELADGFSTLTYYLATVTDGKLTLEIRPRKRIVVDFGVICKTCNTGIPVDANLVAIVKSLHDGHNIKIRPTGDAPPKGKLLEMIRTSLGQVLGKPVDIE